MLWVKRFDQLLPEKSPPEPLASFLEEMAVQLCAAELKGQSVCSFQQELAQTTSPKMLSDKRILNEKADFLMG